MGILNALRTGDPRVDMLLAMCFPFIIGYCVEFLQRCSRYLHLDYWDQPKLHKRTIQHASTTTMQDRYGGGGDSSNVDPDSD